MHDDQAGTPEVMGYDGAMERAVIAHHLRRPRLVVVHRFPLKAREMLRDFPPARALATAVLARSRRTSPGGTCRRGRCWLPGRGRSWPAAARNRPRRRAPDRARKLRAAAAP